jgi:hypothetical protein
MSVSLVQEVKGKILTEGKMSLASITDITVAVSYYPTYCLAICDSLIRCFFN